MVVAGGNLRRSGFGNTLHGSAVIAGAGIALLANLQNVSSQSKVARAVAYPGRTVGVHVLPLFNYRQSIRVQRHPGDLGPALQFLPDTDTCLLARAAAAGNFVGHATTEFFSCCAGDYLWAGSLE